MRIINIVLVLCMCIFLTGKVRAQNSKIETLVPLVKFDFSMVYIVPYVSPRLEGDEIFGDAKPKIINNGGRKIAKIIDRKILLEMKKEMLASSRPIRVLERGDEIYELMIFLLNKKGHLIFELRKIKDKYVMVCSGADGKSLRYFSCSDNFCALINNNLININD